MSRGDGSRRSLMNTAKLMETLEKIAEKVDKITVGSFDMLLSSLVMLQK